MVVSYVSLEIQSKVDSEAYCKIRYEFKCVSRWIAIIMEPIDSIMMPSFAPFWEFIKIHLSKPHSK